MRNCCAEVRSEKVRSATRLERRNCCDDRIGMRNCCGKEEEHKNRAENLKEEVKLMFAKSMEVLAKLELIDIFMKLGLSILLRRKSWKL
ncbi:hypothetical protein LWI28_019488 [Acer negundo]|uniref:Uncharacterized protein n=1 Tax=Acer negundo TaxID=4023 RepID=A0AAD5IMD0_ACENE|nr:hypothetical protein LWI28_019488 [Acer negundo]